jgi:hypothetical protein
MAWTPFMWNILQPSEWGLAVPPGSGSPSLTCGLKSSPVHSSPSNTCAGLSSRHKMAKWPGQLGQQPTLKDRDSAQLFQVTAWTGEKAPGHPVSQRGQHQAGHKPPLWCYIALSGILCLNPSLPPHLLCHIDRRAESLGEDAQLSWVSHCHTYS